MVVKMQALSQPDLVANFYQLWVITHAITLLSVSEYLIIKSNNKNNYLKRGCFID